MSAISAVCTKADGPSASWLLQQMLGAQERYGPDRTCSWYKDRIALGGSFFSFLPEDQFDTQPLWSDDRSTCLIADVRLDNRADLARELGLVHPEERSDSFFLLAAWLRWGPSCLDRIFGGFAFAIWTPGRKELFAARDHVGERPLYYHRGKNLFALASMPKGLLAIPGASQGFQESRVIQWLAGLPYDADTTFFAGIERLAAGHFLQLTPDTFEVRQYWHPANAKPTRYKRDEDYAEALVEVLDAATLSRLRTTKSIGSFLSAGLDSSAVTASAAHLLAAQGKTLTSFTSVPRPDFNGIAPHGYLPIESEGAKALAQLYPNIEHVITDSRGYDLLPTMKTWNEAWDQPSPNLVNSLWITAILEQARQRGIGVMLAGDMGNYTISWDSWSILGYLFRRGQWVKLARTVHGLHSRGAIGYKTAVRFATQSLIPLGITRRFISRKNLDSLYTPLLSPEWIRRSSLDEMVFESVYRGSSNPMDQHSEVFEYYDMGSLNAAVPAISQVEVRDPTADKRVLDFCFSIPFEQYLAGGQSRSLIRRAMKGRVPESILQRKSRGLQSADWYIYIREALPDLRREVDRIEQSPFAREALDLPRLRSLLDTFPDTGYEEPRIRTIWHAALTWAISMGDFLRTHDPALVASPVAEHPPEATPLI